MSYNKIMIELNKLIIIAHLFLINKNKIRFVYLKKQCKEETLLMIQ